MRALRLTLNECADLSAIESAWRALEPRADGSFFRSWSWVGCLAARRFPHPVLLEARWKDRVVALGLLNRRGWLLEPDKLWLGESGERDLDAVFVEHNGLLVERGWSGVLEAHCLRALVLDNLGSRAPWRGRRVLLSGADARVLPSVGKAGLTVKIRSARTAPLVDLDTARARGGTFLDGLSANTRQQIRRSNRRYGEAGPLRVDRAATADIALEFLDGLATLHQQTWTRRNQLGAFANPAFVDFHRALIGRAFAGGSIDLLRFSAGGEVIGYLYNFRYRGRVSAYQSGFAYPQSNPHLKPGLTCHALAIEQARLDGARIYDFLAGDSRYKRSLANAEQKLVWLELLPHCSPRAFLRSGRDLLRFGSK